MKIWAKTVAWAEGKFLVVRRDGSIPHWPHFVLGARDPFAAAALRYYSGIAQDAGFDREYCESIRQLAFDFDAYRAEQGDGDPEAPPHRKDDPHVIAAMRGNPTMIAVRPDKSNVAKESRVWTG
jgi:hypothetical protein